MKHRRNLWLCLLLALVLALAAGCSQNQQPQEQAQNGNSIRVEEKPNIYIGFVSPLSGANQPQGRAAFDAFQMALNAWSKSQQDLPYHLVVVEMDDQGDLEEAAARCEELAGFPETVAVSGFWTNGTAEAGLPAFLKQEIPVVIWGANGDGLVSADTYPLVTRVCPSAQQEAAVLAEQIFGKLEYDNVYLVIEDSEDAVAQGEAFSQEAARWPIEEMGVAEGISSSGELDYSPLLSAIQQSGAELVYYAGSAQGAGKFRAAMAAAGMTDIPLCGTSAIASQRFFSEAGDSAEGCFSVKMGIDLSSTEKGRAFLQQYAAAEFQFPLAEYTEYAYDAALAIIRALESVEGVPTRDAMADAIAKVTVNGVSGTFSFDATGQTTLARGRILTAVNGNWIVQ